MVVHSALGLYPISNLKGDFPVLLLHHDVTIQRIVARLDLSRPWIECAVCFKVSFAFGRETFSQVSSVVT